MALAAAAAALPGCAALGVATRVEGLPPAGCRARYCRHFVADPLREEGGGQCSLAR